MVRTSFCVMMCCKYVVGKIAKSTKSRQKFLNPNAICTRLASCKRAECFRRNHERCKQTSLASHSFRGGFCNISSCGCLHTYNCVYYKRYSAMQNLPMLVVYIRGSVRERRSKAQPLRQSRLNGYILPSRRSERRA